MITSTILTQLSHSQIESGSLCHVVSWLIVDLSKRGPRRDYPSMIRDHLLDGRAFLFLLGTPDMMGQWCLNLLTPELFY